MRETKSRVFWIGKRGKDGYYEMGTSVRTWNKECGFAKEDWQRSFCKDLFEEIIDIKLKIGEVGKFRLVKVE